MPNRDWALPGLMMVTPAFMWGKACFLALREKVPSLITRVRAGNAKAS